ncbi:MAG TPA: radical SAM family heme chaperone HemW [Deltaproteobacteria bacterium]|nr:radical SAM family heme chaperone HemW [Deltaproteobacteria bacterium]HOI07989.1 radical SAM family heme chaperone HemW [Deltaproteobacteria bacterium]
MDQHMPHGSRRRVDNSPGLYIHVPFCISKCGYCDFYSCTDTRLTDEWLGALTREVELWRGGFGPFDTVYLGGGTPSVLSLLQLERLLDAVRGAFDILPGAEVTVEVNPADWGLQDLLVARSLGINRINVGVQSFDDGELRFLGRRHDSRQALAALANARRAGFENVGLDLIYGLPGQGFNTWKGSLEKALLLAPEHLSCYELELKADTPLGLRYGLGELEPRTGECLRELFLRTSELAEGAGYVHYEVSNFARGMEKASRHNRKYWDHTPYLGLGPSAHSFKDNRRWWNTGSIHDYLRLLGEGRKPVAGSEDLGPDQLAFESLFLGLRTREGIDLEEYRDLSGRDLLQEKGPQIESWVREGLVRVEGGFLRPTRSGMAVADALAAL